MGHFFAVVLVPADAADIEAMVAELLAPYRMDDEEYLEDCWCLFDGQALEDCVFCGGTGQSNPNQKYEWYVIGGRWDGEVGKSQVHHDPSLRGVERAFRPGSRTLENNCVPVARIANKDIGCFALLTPDGQWHMWADSIHDWEPTRRQQERWRKKVQRLLGKHSDCLAVGVDCGY